MVKRGDGILEVCCGDGCGGVLMVSGVMVVMMCEGGEIFIEVESR